MSRPKTLLSLALASFVALSLLTSCASVDDENAGDEVDPYADSSSDAGAPEDAETLGAIGADPDVAPDTAGTAGTTGSALDAAYFPFDSAVLSRAAVTALKRSAAYMKENSGATMQIEGHCDERGTVEYNLALGERRAAAARKYLQKLGVSGSRVTVVSYGEERPADPGHTEEAWSRNRRAEFVVSGN